MMDSCSVARPGYTMDAVCSGDLVFIVVEPDGHELPSPDELKGILMGTVGPSTTPVMLTDLGTEPSLSAAAVLYASRLLLNYKAHVLAVEEPLVMIRNAKGEDLGTIALRDDEWMSPRLQEALRGRPRELEEMAEAVASAWAVWTKENLRRLSDRVRRFIAVEGDVPVPRDWQKTLRVERP